MLSNPTGGPEQSKRAAQQLSDANAEIPKALPGGAQKVNLLSQTCTTLSRMSMSRTPNGTATTAGLIS